MANMFPFIQEQSVLMDGFVLLLHWNMRNSDKDVLVPSAHPIFFPVHKISNSLTNNVKIMSFKFYLQKTSTAIQASNINITKRLATLSKRLKAECSDKQHPLLLCI